MVGGLSIYFFTSRGGRGREAFDAAQALFANERWELLTIETPEEREAFESKRHEPDLILSFLNPYIVPALLLDAARLGAFNVHPATPDYPGRDPQHFAYYEGAAVAGATLHRMVASVDSGEILDVIEEPFDRSDGVMALIERSEVLSVTLLLRNVERLLRGSTEPQGAWTWRVEAKRTRHDFLEMCRLTPDLTPEEVRRRIDAFFNPEYRSLHVDLHGYRFVYEPEASSRDNIP